MANITLKLNASDLAKIYEKTALLEKNLLKKDGEVYKYVLTIGDGYTEAVISGMGTTVTGVATLKSFLGEAKSVKWKPNTKATIGKKVEMGWTLEVWKASGETEEATRDSFKITSSGTKIDMFAGIDGTRFAEAFNHAYRTEFGVAASEGQTKFNGRALFTLLNVLLSEKSEVIRKGFYKAVEKEIKKIKWGS